MPYLIEKMPEMPSLVYKSLKAIADGEYQLNQIRELEKIREEIKQNGQRSLSVISGSSMLVAAAIIYSSAGAATLVFNAPMLSSIVAVTGILFIVLGIRK